MFDWVSDYADGIMWEQGFYDVSNYDDVDYREAELSAFETALQKGCNVYIYPYNGDEMLSYLR